MSKKLKASKESIIATLQDLNTTGIVKYNFENSNSKLSFSVIREDNYTINRISKNIEKLVSFMQETGGTIEDYVRLNADYSNVNNIALLKEYYKNYDGASGAKSFNDELLKKMMDELTTIRTKMLS